MDDQFAKDVNEVMGTSEEKPQTTKANIYSDLLSAQKEIENVAKDATNPFFKSGYATLNATIDACKQILNKYNFVILQPVHSDENGVYVATTLLHISGQQITSRMRIESAKPHDPQAQGSAITYARRYSLQSMLCMSAVDDDGESATNHEVKAQANSTETKMCPIHEVEMTKRWSEKRQKHYFAHNLPEGDFCFGVQETRQ